MISVIMAHYKREEKLYNTLWAYRHMHSPEMLKNVEFVIVDDDRGKSGTFWRVIEFHKKALNITVGTMDEGAHNTSGPMNFGLKLAVGDLFVMTNPENIPVTRNMLVILEKLMTGKPKRHLAGACYSLDQKDSNAFTFENVCDRTGFLKAVSRIRVEGRRFEQLGAVSGWRQHTKYVPTDYFFLSAIWRDQLFRLRGFDEDYMRGQGKEDIDLVLRARRMGMEMFRTNSLVVYHQYHFGPDHYRRQPDRRMKVAINTKTYKAVLDRRSFVCNVGREWGTPKSAGLVERWQESGQKNIGMDTTKDIRIAG